MEYPMITLITGERSLRSLVGVTVHEMAHSWFQAMVATNESLHEWMDEGSHHGRNHGAWRTSLPTP